jgi:hypothetical protein
MDELNATHSNGPANVEEFRVRIHFPCDYSEEEKAAIVFGLKKRIALELKHINATLLSNRDCIKSQ